MTPHEQVVRRRPGRVKKRCVYGGQVKIITCALMVNPAFPPPPPSMRHARRSISIVYRFDHLCTPISITGPGFFPSRRLIKKVAAEAERSKDAENGCDDVASRSPSGAGFHLRVVSWRRLVLAAAAARPQGWARRAALEETVRARVPRCHGSNTASYTITQQSAHLF